MGGLVQSGAGRPPQQTRLRHHQGRQCGIDPLAKTRIREWYGSFPFLRTVGNNIILHAGPPFGVTDGDSLIRLTDGMTLGGAFRTKQLTGTYISLVHGIVWDRDYIRSAIGWEKFSGSGEAENLQEKNMAKIAIFQAIFSLSASPDTHWVSVLHRF